MPFTTDSSVDAVGITIRRRTIISAATAEAVRRALPACREVKMPARRGMMPPRPARDALLSPCSRRHVVDGELRSIARVMLECLPIPARSQPSPRPRAKPRSGFRPPAAPPRTNEALSQQPEECRRRRSALPWLTGRSATGKCPKRRRLCMRRWSQSARKQVCTRLQSLRGLPDDRQAIRCRLMSSLRSRPSHDFPSIFVDLAYRSLRRHSV